MVDDNLCAVLSVKNFYPGKGVPTTKTELRRIKDGVKISKRWKTTDVVERAILDEATHDYLYELEDGYVFMHSENYDQVVVPKDIIGDQSIYLQPEMKVQVSLFEGNPISVVLPQKVSLTVTDTEPVTKRQTATASYKPATLSNGVRTSVPSHVVIGTEIMINTEDGSYDGVAKA